MGKLIRISEGILPPSSMSSVLRTLAKAQKSDQSGSIRSRTVIRALYRSASIFAGAPLKVSDELALAMLIQFVEFAVKGLHSKAISSTASEKLMHPREPIEAGRQFTDPNAVNSRRPDTLSAPLRRSERQAHQPT